MTTFPRSLSLLLLAALLCASGCMGPSLFKKTQKLKRSSAYDPATEMICLWQPAKGPGVNHVPTRGCAGRIMFFTRGHASPVIVDGDVRVYLFHNQGTPDEQARPIHQFDFRAEDWHTFLENSPLGPAYNVFIPYTKPGQEQVECTIQVRFTPKDGPVLYSEMTSITLPGKIDPLEAGFLPNRSQRPSSDQAAPAVANNSLEVHTILQNNQVVKHTQPNVSPAANASTPATPSPPAQHAVAPSSSAAPKPEDRLARLERLMEQLLTQQAQPKITSPAEPLAQTPADLHPLSTAADARRHHPLTAQNAPLPADETPAAPSRRFRLAAAHSGDAPAQTSPVSRHQPRSEHPLLQAAQSTTQTSRQHAAAEQSTPQGRQLTLADLIEQTSYEAPADQPVGDADHGVPLVMPVSPAAPDQPPGAATIRDPGKSTAVESIGEWWHAPAEPTTQESRTK